MNYLHYHYRLRTAKLLFPLLAPACVLASNLAPEGRPRSWERPGNLFAIKDSNLHTYIDLPSGRLAVDAGIEWNSPQRIGSVVIRYFDARMARTPNGARTQDWGGLQYWTADHWADLECQRYGTELASARYTFEPVTTTRIRYLMSEPPDPEARRASDRLGIAICEFEAYDSPPFTLIRESFE